MVLVGDDVTQFWAWVCWVCMLALFGYVSSDKALLGRLWQWRTLGLLAVLLFLWGLSVNVSRGASAGMGFHLLGVTLAFLVLQPRAALGLVMLVSLPLVIFPVGYLSNGTGFQGVLNQPQVFGATMAILGAWSAARMIGDRSPSWLVIGLVVACLAMILMSEARIAGVSIVLGLFAAVFTVSAGGRRSIKFSFPGLRSKKVMLVAALAVGGLGLAAGKAESLATHFISKSGRAEATSLLAAYQGSRGGLIGEMWQNIKEKPFTGIGFGIASDVHEMNVQRDPLLGLPLGAPIEKGVLPVAVLEEVGLFGLGFVVAWLWSFLRYWIRGGVVPVSVGLTILLLNMGEATLFSPGGMGLLSLILIGWVVACGQRGAETPQRSGVSKAH